MRRFVTLSVVVSLVALLAAGCSGKKEKVRKLVEGYVIAERSGVKVAPGAYLVKEDRNILEMNSRVSGKHADKIAEVAQEGLADAVSVTVESLETKKKKGTVEAKVTAPSKKAVDSYLSPKMMKVAKKHRGEKKAKVFGAMAEKAREAFANKEFEQQTETRTFDLRKENGSWKIYRNLKARQKISKMLRKANSAAIEASNDEGYEKAVEKVETAAKRAEKHGFDMEGEIKQARTDVTTKYGKYLEDEGRYDEAISLLKTAKEQGVDGGRAGVSSKHAGAELEKVRELKSYEKKLEVVDVETTQEYSSEVKGKVENTGDRTVQYVYVDIALKNDAGKVIGRMRESASVGGALEGGDTIPGGKAGSFSTYVDDEYEKDWSGEVDVSIDDFAFAKADGS